MGNFLVRAISADFVNNSSLQRCTADGPGQAVVSFSGA
jgi:hypothetical protein